MLIQKTAIVLPARDVAKIAGVALPGSIKIRYGVVGRGVAGGVVDSTGASASEGLAAWSSGGRYGQELSATCFVKSGGVAAGDAASAARFSSMRALAADSSASVGAVLTIKPSRKR